eukprot:TRINITY_DN91758_c0_g1_i1.p1 TRINITY_DN91758_c0_g1~~TRINITY_DN91758_c0_g1_i1.p1  ORF type:complete len:206 (+),score=15.41 TRINITY_DN91758_c0_g1_i1:184-801(+)
MELSAQLFILAISSLVVLSRENFLRTSSVMSERFLPLASVAGEARLSLCFAGGVRYVFLDEVTSFACTGFEELIRQFVLLHSLAGHILHDFPRLLHANFLAGCTPLELLAHSIPGIFPSLEQILWIRCLNSATLVTAKLTKLSPLDSLRHSGCVCHQRFQALHPVGLQHHQAGPTLTRTRLQLEKLLPWFYCSTASTALHNNAGA